MRRVRVAQIGTGHPHAAAAFATTRRQEDLFEMLGVAEPSVHFLETMLSRPTYRDFPKYTPEELLDLPGLEAVLIETEEELLTKYALMAAERGLHIHMDKPGGLLLSDFERLVETARKNGSVLHLGYMYRYNPAVQELLQQVKKGDLGKILCVEAQMSCSCSRSEKQRLDRFPGGMLFFLGCHLIDLILQIMGTPDQILPLSGSSGLDGSACLDQGMAALVYPTGVSFAKSSASEPGGFYRRQLVVCGTEKTVELKPLEALLPQSMQYTDRCDYVDVSSADAAGREPGEFLQTCRTAPFHRYRDMMRAFGRMAAGELENPYSYDYELLLYRTLLRCCGVEL